ARDDGTAETPTQQGRTSGDSTDSGRVGFRAFLLRSSGMSSRRPTGRSRVRLLPLRRKAQRGSMHMLKLVSRIFRLVVAASSSAISPMASSTAYSPPPTRGRVGVHQ